MEDIDGWVPVDACTLPTAERPLRLAEFADLSRSVRAARRPEPGWLRLLLVDGDGVEERVRDLAARESACCSFFAFDVHRDTDGPVLDVRVPVGRVDVLDGLAAQLAGSA